jgi:hypothetical protein
MYLDISVSRKKQDDTIAGWVRNTTTACVHRGVGSRNSRMCPTQALSVSSGQKSYDLLFLLINWNYWLVGYALRDDSSTKTSSLPQIRNLRHLPERVEFLASCWPEVLNGHLLHTGPGKIISNLFSIIKYFSRTFVSSIYRSTISSWWRHCCPPLSTAASASAKDLA